MKKTENEFFKHKFTIMKIRNTYRYVILFLLILVPPYAYAQEFKMYSNEKAHLTLKFPSTFREVPINNAPHMLLHIENEKEEEYIISFWEYGIDESYDIWNPEFFKEVENNAHKIQGAELISCSKKKLNIREKTIKAVQMIHLRDDGIKKKYVVTYQTLWRGNLIQIMYISKGDFAFMATKGRTLFKYLQLN